MTPDRPRVDLARLTPARVMLGRVGAGLPLAETLRFQLAHSRARDAVHLPFDAETLAADLGLRWGVAVAALRSRAEDRRQYLANPDLGRRLRPEDRDKVRPSGAALAVVVADGLSSRAAVHAAPLLDLLLPALRATGIEAALFVAAQARVALGDEIGALAGADLTLMLIGERPGLSSPDSLGAYLTFAPRLGRRDAERNCVSNIRPEGLAFEDAAARLRWLIAAARARGGTGVALKDESPAAMTVAGPQTFPHRHEPEE